jgi:hypothetical protein
MIEYVPTEVRLLDRVKEASAIPFVASSTASSSLERDLSNLGGLERDLDASFEDLELSFPW